MSDGEQPAESQLESDSAAFQSHCHSCGVPWESHMGIAGTCALNAQLTKERDEALSQRDAERREYCELCAPEWGFPSPQWLAKDKGWDCYEKETT